IIVGENNIPNSVFKIIKIKQAVLKTVNFDWFIKNKKKNWDYCSYKRDVYNLPYPKVSVENVSVALTALFHSPFNISDATIIDSIKNITLPGRFQIISDAPKIIFDVAHNPHAVLHLVKRLGEIPKFGKMYVIMGVLKDKDIIGMIVNLKKIVDYWYCVPIFSDRGVNMSQLINILPKSFNILGNIKTAWIDIRSRIKREDILLVFGSFYLIAEAMKIINLNTSI
ncbi:MAG TPA: cyanophycin synthetase, partial [Buchnera sp. (in: enterobacteria)]|nr:cyanophycin synthetase [Buchnera sp. (in: enterobacteria)]